MSLLDEIVKNKTREIRQQVRKKPISELLERVRGQRKPNSFSEVLRNEKVVQIIAEIKRASPSAGSLREHFEPVEIAESYKKNGAAAISVLTDERFFAGALDYLRQVRMAVDMPLLRKDFILDPYQVIEARVFGANAVLLIMAILSNSQFSELRAAAKELNLDCLVEVHNSKELERAMMAEPTIVGVNNRDLTTFEVDLSITEKLLEIIPEEIIIVSESGIKSRKDVEFLGQFGVDAVLIGEALMRHADVGKALSKFVGAEKWSR